MEYMLESILKKLTHTSSLISGVLYTLGLLRGEAAEHENESPYQQATVYMPEGSPEAIALIDPKNAEGVWHVTSLSTLATSLRIWKAMHSETDVLTEGTNSKLIKEVLGGSTGQLGVVASQDEEHRGADFDSSELGYRVSQLCEAKNLNQSQRTAVMDVVLGDQRPRSSVKIIEGPPGTGKTSTVVAMLLALAGRSRRALVSAPTNVAVSEVALRLLRELQTAGSEMPGWRTLGIGDIALVRNEDGLNVWGGALEALYLPARAKRLARALSPVTGWVAAVRALSSFLRSADEQYGHLVKEARAEEGEEIDQPMSFQEYVGKRIQVGGCIMQSLCILLQQSLGIYLMRCL
jgi:hypothetical protein